MIAKDTKKKIIFDCILIAAILLIALSAIFILRACREEGNFVRVSVGGEVFAEYPLDKDGEYVLNGGSNVLKIEGGYAYMIYGDCHEDDSKKCTVQPKIPNEFDMQFISCLPNRVFVEIIKK